jgi:hypothetical protein
VALVAAAAAAVAGFVAVAGAQAFWRVRSRCGCWLVVSCRRAAAALLAAFAVLAAAAPALLDPGLGPLPPAVLTFAVPG